MSLKDDLNELAKRLKDAVKDEVIYSEIHDVAAELRGIAKGLPSQSPLLMPPEEGLFGISKAIREQERKEVATQEAGALMALVVGGPLDGDYAPVDPAMPVRARTLIGGGWYVKQENGNLVFNKELTDQFSQSQR